MKSLNLIKWWLIGILLILPVKDNISSLIGLDNQLVLIVNYMDELTIAILFLPAIWLLYKNKNGLSQFYLYLIIALFIFCLSGEISGIINGNSFFVTTLGIFDYIKSFLVLFVYAAFFRTFEDFRKIFQLLLIATVFLGVLAFTEEMWALAHRYLLGKNIHDINYLLNKVQGAPEVAWRFGLYRATSLFNNANSLGFHCLFILVIYLQTARKINRGIVIVLCCAIFFTLSRMAYSGFVLIIGTMLILNRGRRISCLTVVTLIPVVILLIYMAELPDFNLIRYISGGGIHSEESIPFRVYTVSKSMEIWQDHPLWGVGPGLFGGVVSLKYNSYIYCMYNFDIHALSLINAWKAVDQFWPRLLGEIGIVGAVLFIHILISLPILCIMKLQQEIPDKLKKLLSGVAISIIIIFIMTIGGGISFSLMYIYYAIAGTAFSIIKRNEFTAQ